MSTNIKTWRERLSFNGSYTVQHDEFNANHYIGNTAIALARDAETAELRAALEARNSMVPLSEDGESVWIDGRGSVSLAPISQPVGAVMDSDIAMWLDMIINVRNTDYESYSAMSDAMQTFAQQARAALASLPSQPAPEAAREKESLWHPIETAPRDGKTLLLGYFNSLGNWRTMRGQWFSQAAIDDEWEDPDEAMEGWYETAVEPDVPNCWPTQPTHWQRLPAAPSPAQAQPVAFVPGGLQALVDMTEQPAMYGDKEVRPRAQPAADAAPAAAKPDCRMQGGICACRSGGSYGGCAIERQASGNPLFANANQPSTAQGDALSQAAQDVLAERSRQVDAEGMERQYDDKYTHDELRRAAAIYAYPEVAQHSNTIWPWATSWMKFSTPRRDAVKAAALLIAEIERIDRAAIRALATKPAEG